MNVTFNQNEQLNGFTITGRIGLSRYVAENDQYSICFDTEAGEGRNYSNIQWYTDKRTKRHYRSMRYLIKHVALVQSFSSSLYMKYKAENAEVQL